MVTVKLVVTVRIQWWKLNTCLQIINALYWIGLIDEDRALDMAMSAVSNSVAIVAPRKFRSRWGGSNLWKALFF